MCVLAGFDVNRYVSFGAYFGPSMFNENVIWIELVNSLRCHV